MATPTSGLSIQLYLPLHPMFLAHSESPFCRHLHALLHFAAVNRVGLVHLGRVKLLPPRRREDVLVPVPSVRQPHQSMPMPLSNVDSSLTSQVAVAAGVIQWTCHLTSWLPSASLVDGLTHSNAMSVHSPVVPVALDDLAGVRLVLLPAGVVHQPHVLVHVKVEQRPALPPRLCIKRQDYVTKSTSRSE